MRMPSTGTRCLWLLALMATAVSSFAAPAVALRNAPSISIYDALRDDNQDGRPDLLGKAVTVHGVLTLPPRRSHTNEPWSSYLQDETAALRVRGRRDGEGGLTRRERAELTAWFIDNFKIDDELAVRGVLLQANGTTELRVDEASLLANGASVLARDVWSADLQNNFYQSQLVRVRGEVIRGTRNKQLEFLVRDTRGKVPVALQPEFFMSAKGEFGYQLWKGGEAEITGIAVRDSNLPTSAGLALLVRKPEDVRFVPPPPPPPSRMPLYLALGAAALLGLLAVYYWERRRVAEERNRETSRLLYELRRSQAEIKKQATFASLNPNPVLEFFADGTLTYWNDSARETASRLQCAFVRDLLPPNIAELVTKALASPSSRVNAEVKINGRTLSWSLFAIPEITSVHAYGMDITDQLNLEAQLRQSQKIESVGQLAAGVAHDFNNMLAVIQGYTSLTLMRSDLSPKVGESLTEILSASERAGNLTRQLLTFSRKRVMEQRTLDLNELVADLAKMLRRLIGEDVRLKVTRDDKIANVHVDPGMMEQVIVNLAVNARDAMPDGGELFIEVRNVTLRRRDVAHRFEARAGEFVCLTVADDGCGMDEDTLKRMFEPFFTTKEPGKGTGLGLATVHGIVKQHGGWVEVNSKPDEGATFRIYLPVSKHAPQPMDDKVIRLPVAGGTETILVVEDDPALRKLARGVLEEYGYGVLDAASAAEALGLWRDHREQIQLLFTDIILPDGMSGWKLAERLREENPELKVIYSTGFDSESLTSRFDLRPSHVVLRKPYPVQTLVRAVRESLDKVSPIRAMGTSQVS
jgi:signal transduction histidine kinase/ActR/RegA family two-component response regulator